jgi:Fur family peroxide stress response transcriptional regulator
MINMISEITKIFKEKNIKSTPQRIAIYEILINTKSHPTVEDVYNILKPKYPTISLATVYKTLEAFKNLNLVQEINMGENKARYDANILAHTHVQCTKCGRVFDIEPEPIGSLISSLPKDLDFKINSQQVYFFGICPQCQSSTNENSAVKKPTC